MRRLLCAASLGVLVTGLTPATALAQQSFGFYVGVTAPRAEDARDRDDVLIANRAFLDFNIEGFQNGTIGAEWLVGLGSHLDAGLGIGFYQNTETAVDRFSVFEDTGYPIVADLKLRIVPYTATVRVLPFGRNAAVQPVLRTWGWRFPVAVQRDGRLCGRRRGDDRARCICRVGMGSRACNPRRRWFSPPRRLDWCRSSVSVCDGRSAERPGLRRIDN